MIEPKTITESMMYCTARIVTDIGSVGTGFFYNFPLDSGGRASVTMLVTNKHVIDGAAQTSFTVHTSTIGPDKPNGRSTLQYARGDWLLHPNPKIDLCAVLLGSHIPPVFYRSLGPDLLPSPTKLEELSAVEEILMVGYPNGLWDEKNNYPLIRRGITASHPAVDYDLDGVPTFVIDAACFPGSSGSPVFLHNVGTYARKAGGMGIGTRTMLLGILFSGPVHRTDGRIVVRNIPTTTASFAELDLMMNLGYVIKARELDGLRAPLLEKIGPRPFQH